MPAQIDPDAPAAAPAADGTATDGTTAGGGLKRHLGAELAAMAMHQVDNLPIAPHISPHLPPSPTFSRLLMACAPGARVAGEHRGGSGSSREVLECAPAALDPPDLTAPARRDSPTRRSWSFPCYPSPRLSLACHTLPCLFLLLLAVACVLAHPEVGLVEPCATQAAVEARKKADEEAAAAAEAAREAEAKAKAEEEAMAAENAARAQIEAERAAIAAEMEAEAAAKAEKVAADAADAEAAAAAAAEVKVVEDSARAVIEADRARALEEMAAEDAAAAAAQDEAAAGSAVDDAAAGGAAVGDGAAGGGESSSSADEGAGSALVLAVDDIQVGRAIASGAEADVFRGLLWGQKVAVKRLKTVNDDDGAEKAADVTCRPPNLPYPPRPTSRGATWHAGLPNLP